MNSAILAMTDLATHAAAWRANGRTIVLTNGCFDLLHAGHLQTFIAAKRLGDILVVGINSDRSVSSLKGPTRPLINQEQRALLIAALKPVDFVTIFDQNDARLLLETVRPHVYVKGGDYTLDNLPEKETLARLDTQVVFIPLVAGVSTTELVRKIQTANWS